MVELNNVKAFVLGGNATITVQNGESAPHYTYKIIRCKDNDNLYFIHSLRGPDNENDYTYIGCYYDDSEYFHVAKKYANSPSYTWPNSARLMLYVLKNLEHKPDSLKIYHEGRCARCGRKLTTPESITSGFGPECIKFI